MDRMIKQIFCILDLSCKIPYAKKKANIVEKKNFLYCSKMQDDIFVKHPKKPQNRYLLETLG